MYGSACLWICQPKWEETRLTQSWWALQSNHCLSFCGQPSDIGSAGIAFLLCFQTQRSTAWGNADSAQAHVRPVYSTAAVSTIIAAFQQHDQKECLYYYVAHHCEQVDYWKTMQMKIWPVAAQIATRAPTAPIRSMLHFTTQYQAPNKMSWQKSYGFT